MYVRKTLLLLLILTLPVFAQEENKKAEKQTEEDLPFFDYEEIIITATRTQRKVSNITSAVSVIDLEEIEASNSNYVMDVIGSQPGIYIRKDAVFGRQSIEIRGLGSNCRRIQTLIDGRPEKMALFGCTVTQTLPLSNIEKIEVIRGPESVLYGTDALGGVVNIITKKVLTQGYETSALFSYGAYNSFHTLLQQGGNFSNFDYYMTYDYKGSDGHRDNSEYKGSDASVRLGYAPFKNWRMELSGKYFKDDAQDPGTTAEPHINGDKREYERYSWDFDVKGTWAKSDILLNFYQNIGKHQFTMPTIEDFWHSKDNSYGVTLKGSQELYNNAKDIRNVITAGYDYKYEWAETLEPYNSWAQQNMPVNFMNLGEFNRHNNDVFAFNELTVKKFINTIGVRFHHNDIYGWKVLPQIGFMYHLTTGTSIRAKVGKGFRQPKFSELYLFPAHNETLEPEENISYEIALNHRVSRWAAFFVNPFYMDIKNFIQTVSNTSPPPMYVNKNIGAFIIKGIEAGINIKTPMDKLSITMYGTYMDIEDPEYSGHEYVKGMPEFKYNTVINYRYKKLRLSLNGQYIAGLYDANLFSTSEIEKVDNFFVANLKSSYQINNNIQYFLGIENLFDTDYEQFPGYPMPGFSVHSGLKFGF